MHVLLGYAGNNSVPANNFDLSALTPEGDFSIRNGHYFFTEQLSIAYLMSQSAHITDARLTSPTFLQLNADGFRITGFQKKAGVGGVPSLADRFAPGSVMLPLYEEIQGQASTGTAEEQWLLMSLMTPGGPIPVPAGQIIVVEGTTSSFTPSANVWSGAQGITLNASLKGGVYAVVRATCQQAADTLAFRIVFNRHPMFRGRKLRPGWIAQNAVGDFEDVITQVNPFHLGTWGAFWTTELPQLEVLATTSAAMTPIVRLWLVYLGGSPSLLDQFIQQYTVN